MSPAPSLPADDFHKVFIECWRAAYRAANGVLRNRGLAEDVAAEACFRILIVEPPEWAWSHPEALPPYVAWKARKLALDQLRRIRVRGEVDIEGLMIAHTDADAAVRAETRSALGRCLEQLDPETREIVILHVVEGYTFRELAEMMKTTIPKVAARYYRGLIILRGCIERVDAGGRA